jgi:hypothetical protein
VLWHKHSYFQYNYIVAGQVRLKTLGVNLLAKCNCDELRFRSWRIGKVTSPQQQVIPGIIIVERSFFTRKLSERSVVTLVRTHRHALSVKTCYIFAAKINCLSCLYSIGFICLGKFISKRITKSPKVSGVLKIAFPP